MNTMTKKIVLSGLVVLLSACAHYPNNYSSYPSNGSYYSGSNYPGSYPSSYGNYQNNNYPRYPAQSGYGGYGRPYSGYPSNNNYYQSNNYYNRPQPQNYPSPGYRHQGGGSFDLHRDHDNHHQNGGGWQNGNNQPQPGSRPMIGHHQGWQNPPAHREGQPDGGGSGHHGNGFNQQPNEGSWQGHNNQPQQHVQVHHNDGGRSNFGVMNEPIHQQPVQSGQSGNRNDNGNNHQHRQQKQDDR